MLTSLTNEILTDTSCAALVLTKHQNRMVKSDIANIKSTMECDSDKRNLEDKKSGHLQQLH